MNFRSKLEAGKHDITWTGKNQKGLNVSSGIYFFRMKTANRIYVKKAILLK